MQSLYAASLKGEQEAVAGELDKLLSVEPAEKEIEVYARKLLQTVTVGENDAETKIRGALSSWTFERLTPVELCILRVGLAELEGNLGVPPIVAIDEAIRLAKEFGTKNSEKFINGVLDAIFKKKKPAA